MSFIFYLFFAPAIIIFVEFTGFLIKGKRVLNRWLMLLAEIGSLVYLPFLYAGFGGRNECCLGEIDSTAFAPPHQLTVIVIILLFMVSYFYSKFRKQLAPPLAEVGVNVVLVTGILFNIVMLFHVKEGILLVFGPLPIIMAGVLMLLQNQQLFRRQLENEKVYTGKIELFAWKVLSAKPLIKFPLLLVLCLPFLLILTTVLLLFGQKPDSLIRAFTDTYAHGLSQWDYKCDNVECGGHYLCSVAANGHKRLVKPVRYGTRNNGIIICNRQLLVANAFEELLQERMPAVHRFIRTQYNKVGNLIHRYYNIFNNKIISDIVYILMKPLEWCFLLVLYSFDSKPENRIATQYLAKTNRAATIPQ